MSSLRNRLARLEGLAAARLPEEAGSDRWWWGRHGLVKDSDEWWYARFHQWGQKGAFAAAPDFPVALSLHKEAILAAKAEGGFDPPVDYQPDGCPIQRLRDWRKGRTFPAVEEARGWLMVLQLRVSQGTTPVSEAEWADLLVWLEETFGPVLVGRGRGPETPLTDAEKRGAYLLCKMRESGPRAWPPNPISSGPGMFKEGAGEAARRFRAEVSEAPSEEVSDAARPPTAGPRLSAVEEGARPA